MVRVVIAQILKPFISVELHLSIEIKKLKHFGDKVKRNEVSIYLLFEVVEGEN
jgi:hypothetical protein